MLGPLLRSAAVPAALVVAAACGSSNAGDELTVFAASSLTEAFGDVAEAFEADHPDVVVQLNVAGSATLREQILGGAPADVIATADLAAIEPLRAADLLVGAPRPMAVNDLVLAVPSRNPGEVLGLGDLADPDRLVGVCVAEVPCGRLADEAFAAAGVTPALDTREPNVRAVRTKLLDAELDAGLVYRTDVRDAGGRLIGIELPVPVSTSYPIAVVADGPADPSVAEDFVDFVLGAEGQAILAEHGFGVP